MKVCLPQQRRVLTSSRKFKPRCDSDKQTIPWAASLRATYDTTVFVSSSVRYSASYLAIRWPFQLKMLEKTHEMHREIITMQSPKESRKIMGFSCMKSVYEYNRLPPQQKKYYCTRPDLIRCVALSSHIQRTVLQPALLMYRAKHTYEMYAAEIYSQSKMLSHEYGSIKI